MITFTEDQINKAYAAAPVAAQEAIEEGSVATAVSGVAKKHSLHVDATGNMAGMASSLLLGLLSPTQFVEELQKNGVEKNEASALLQELNDVLFKPLLTAVQDELGTRENKHPPSSSTPPAAKKIELAPPIPLSQKPPTPQPVMQQAKPVVPVSLSSAPAAPRPVTAPPVRTMALDVKGMNAPASQREKQPLLVPVPPSAPKLTPFVPPRPSTPPVIAPTTSKEPNTTTPVQTPTALITHKAAGALTHEEVSASLKQYGIDPYREPVE